MRRGGTKRWISAETAAVSKARIEAHRAYACDPTEENKQKLEEAVKTAKLQHRHAMRQRRTKLERDCITAWRRNPHSRAAHKTLERIALKAERQPICALKHPVTGELCTTGAEKSDAMAQHCAHLAKAPTPRCEEERHQVQASEATAAALRADACDGPEEYAAPVTPAEVLRALQRMANNKAPGEDGMPVELLKHAGPDGALALAKLFNTIMATECIPSAWRQGVVVSVYKADDPTDCGNYRPLTLLTAMDKLWSTIISLRLAAHVDLHDHQYGFRAKRGTTNALFNLTTLLRQRIPEHKPLFAFFLDARKAFDTVPHAALMAKLAEKGVTGKLWRLIDQMYRQARSRTVVDGVESAPFPIEQGVAQGCPLSPLLYIIFADDMLETLHADTAQDGVQLATDQGGEQCFAGQSYADDLAGLAETAEGLQRIIDALHRHSREWGWTANTKKSVVMVFGDSHTRTTRADTQWTWADVPLQRVATYKYLGLHLHESGGWDEHVAQTARKANVAFLTWAPVLASPRLSVALKLTVIKTRIIPILTYAMEVWSPAEVSSAAEALKPLQDVCDKACRLACGLHRTKHSKAWHKQRGVSMAVLRADVDILPMDVHMSLAHATYRARMEDLDKTPGEHGGNSMSVTYARDKLGALLRSNLAPNDTWLEHANRIADPSNTPADLRIGSYAHQRALLKQEARKLAANERILRAVPAAHVPTHSRSGRPLRPVQAPAELLHPVAEVLGRADTISGQSYVRAANNLVWPIMTLRGAHLPGDFSAHADEWYVPDREICPHCDAVCIRA